MTPTWGQVGGFYNVLHQHIVHPCLPEGKAMGVCGEGGHEGERHCVCNEDGGFLIPI